MSVKITDLCIKCGSCLPNCPVGAIVDEDENPKQNNRFFVYKDKCVECIGYNELPACAIACPTEGCIIWGKKTKGHQEYIKNEPVLM